MEDEVTKAMKAVSELCLIEDPPEEPFRSKYKAREELKKTKQRLLREDDGGATKQATASVALIDYHLGVVALAVEENSAAQEALDKCAEAFFEGVVGKVVAAAGHEDDDGEEEEGKQANGKTDKKPPLPFPAEAPTGMANPSPLAWDRPAEAADTLTQLGILWAGRGYPRRSVLYLLASVGFLRQASSSQRLAAAAAAGNGNGCEGNAEGLEKRKANLENLLTHTFYYLAQAYGVRDVKQSARYCTLTLERQLDASQRGEGAKVSFNPGEWSRNACFLADYYGGLKRYSAAGKCLLAAQAVLAGQAMGAKKPGAGQTGAAKDHGKNEQDAGKGASATGVDATLPPPPPPPEKTGRVGERKGEEEEEGEERREQRADVHRHMAKLYINVLQTKHQKYIKREDNVPFPPEKKGRGAGGGEEGEEDGLKFGSLEIGDLPLCDPDEVGDDFESVRDVFKRAKSHTDQALRHYVLDGFVTAHVALQQGLSRAYTYLSTYESDTKRKLAMAKRRTQALEPLLRVLAPKAYGRLHKELSFELGEINQEISSLRITRMEEKTDEGINHPEDGEVIMKYLRIAVGFFSHFIAMYHEGDPTRGAADSPAQPAKGMESEEVVGYLQARFMRARLNGRIVADEDKLLNQVRLSCAEFTWVVKHGPGLLSVAREQDPELFVEELKLASDMAEMQTRNIARIEASLQ